MIVFFYPISLAETYKDNIDVILGSGPAGEYKAAEAYLSVPYYLV